MSFQHKVNHGNLFKNQNRDADTANKPPLSGDGLIQCPKCGQKYLVWINGWSHESKSGTKFLSLSIKPKEEWMLGPAEQKPKPKPNNENQPEFLQGASSKTEADDVPF